MVAVATISKRQIGRTRMASIDYYALGMRFAACIREGNVPISVPLMRSVIADLFAGSEDLMVPFKDLVGRPGFKLLVAKMGSGNGAIERDSLVDLLRSIYSPWVLTEIAEFLDGVIGIERIDRHRSLAKGFSVNQGVSLSSDRSATALPSHKPSEGHPDSIAHTACSSNEGSTAPKPNNARAGLPPGRQPLSVSPKGIYSKNEDLREALQRFRSTKKALVPLQAIAGLVIVGYAAINAMHFSYECKSRANADVSHYTISYGRLLDLVENGTAIRLLISANGRSAVVILSDGRRNLVDISPGAMQPLLDKLDRHGVDVAFQKANPLGVARDLMLFPSTVLLRFCE